MNFVSCNLVWNPPCNFTIKRVHSTNSFESQVWFQTKTARYEVQLPLPRKGNFLVSTKFYWSSTEIVCNVLQDFPNGLFVFHFPSIWLVTLNEPGNLIGCFVSVWISLNITFVQSLKFFQRTIMAKCHVISQTIQVCPLQWLRMIDDVGQLQSVMLSIIFE